MLETEELGKTEIAANATAAITFYASSVKKALNEFKSQEKKMEKAVTILEKVSGGGKGVGAAVRQVKIALKVINLEQKLLKARDSECWKAVKKVMSKTQRINKFSDKAKYESTDLLGEFDF
jgi:hypothetical protein